MSILVVDDDPIARLIIEKNLKLLNYGDSIQKADNGEEALFLIEENPPSAIFLDLNMPIKGGFEVLDELRASNKDILVFVITSSSLSADREKCSEYKCVKGFFEKPVLKNDIERVIQLLNEKN